jgi:hypothetical protein
MDAGFLTRKVILILSPQSWGKMMLAKHHYAIELAKRGNKVYFLNPPDNDHWSWNGKRIYIEQVEDNTNLFIIHQQLYFPYNLKFHSRFIYNLLIKRQIKQILKTIPEPVDLIWSFDLGNLFPLSFFSENVFKIFHPVDEPTDQNAIEAAVGSNMIFSVSQEILSKYANFKIPSYFINHGVAEEFLSVQPHPGLNRKNINVGMSGNLLRQDLDRKILLQIVEENLDLFFNFYGSYNSRDSNIGAGTDEETAHFIKKLGNFRNVKLYGVLKTVELARELNSMDLLLICYDIEKDQSKGTNYHKVMEYLSTGKVIISNNITTYANKPDLIRMSKNRSGNKELPALFRETATNLTLYNTPELIEKRKHFAFENTYLKQLETIEGEIKRKMESGNSILNPSKNKLFGF